MCLKEVKIIEDRYSEFMKYFEKKITSKNEKVETNLESYRSEVTLFKTEIVKEINADNQDTKEIKEGMIPPTCNTSALINSGNQPGSVQGRQKEQCSHL